MDGSVQSCANPWLPGEQPWLVAYDIADPRRLYKVARLLNGVGVRVQRSVFECLLDRMELARLRIGLGRIIDLAEDRVRCYPLPRPCCSVGEAIGSTRGPGGYYVL
jgi:CRISPR-associated protein Cas2